MGSLRRHDVSTSAIAWVCQSLILYYIKMFGIDIETLALHIALVPIHSQPLQVIIYLPGIFLARPLLVYVLYPEHKLSVPAPCREPGQQRRIDIAKMHSPRWRWGESSFWLLPCPIFKEGGVLYIIHESYVLSSSRWQPGIWTSEARDSRRWRTACRLPLPHPAPLTASCRRCSTG